jgi:hypothetical protein
MVISHATSDTLPPGQVAEGTRIYNRASDLTLRTRPQIERFLAGVDLVDPGLVLVAMFGAIGQLRNG